MTRFLFILSGLLVFTANLVAQESEYEKFLRQQSQQYGQMVEQYEKGVAASLQEYEEFEKRWMAEFESFKKEQKRTWGDFLERSKKDWVEYRNGGKTRSSVDFASGKARVEIIANTPAEVEAAKKQMAQEIVQTVTQQPTAAGFQPKDQKLENRPVSKKPALQGQIQTGGKPVQQVAERMASQEVQTKQVKGEDGQTRTVVYVDFSLAPDHLKKRAETVQDFVYKYAKTYNIDPAMVFAIIHTESYYNPTAKSPANAHGLMQVVPTSAGRDAYKAVFSRDGIPTPEWLYEPDNNVNLGSTYMNILRTRYFAQVPSTVTRDYLAICAYNTGAGNVAKAYTGTTSVSKSLPIINGKTDMENYEFLIANLPYEETRAYLKKVHERRLMYQQWMKNQNAEVR